MKNIVICCLLMAISVRSHVYAQFNQKPKVYYVSLEEGRKVESNPIKEYKSRFGGEVNRPKKIRVYPSIKYQTLEGIGGAFNEIGGEALMSLPKNLQNEVMQSLFDPENGCGFSLSRTAIGASDFGINAYSYSEKSNDYTMKHFSVEREKKTVLPYIRKAIAFNPNLNVFASPWSPPGWMKYSGYMDRGTEFPGKNVLIDRPEIYQAYALYFAKYVQAYAENGIDIKRLVVQNENDIGTKYPSCEMPPDQMGKLITGYINGQFKKDGLKTEIWAGTFRAADQFDAIEYLEDEKSKEAVTGIGIQYTNPNFLSDIRYLHPDLKIMHTEGACYNGENNVKQARNRLGEVVNYLNSGCVNFCYWNMILNETGKSGWDWKQNSLINIDRESMKVTYNPDYAVMYLLSKFIRPGASRLSYFSRSSATAVTYKDGIAFFTQNDSEEVAYYEYTIGNKKEIIEVPAQSLCAIVVEKLDDI